MPGSGTTAANRSPAFPPGVGDTITLTLPETLGDATDPGRDIGAPITATDPDLGDSVSYSLEGTDADSFTVTSTGQVRTKADRTYDHEARQTYDATLVAEDDEVDNTGRTTVQLVIEITDEDEPPLAPAQPTFTGVSRHQTTVNWTAPSNTGRPDISGYQVKRHLKGDSAEGTPQDVEKDLEGEPLTSHVAINLEDGKTYLFQVRGENDEGWGEWSEPGEATTPANRIPIFQEGSNAARSLPENSQAGVDAGAALTATDEDYDTLTYSIDGENDGRVHHRPQDRKAPIRRPQLRPRGHELPYPHGGRQRRRGRTGGHHGHRQHHRRGRAARHTPGPGSHRRLQHEPEGKLDRAGQPGKAAHRRIRRPAPHRPG